MQTRRNVLLIADGDETSHILETILDEYSELKRVHDPRHLQAYIERGHYDVVFCAWSFGPGTWVSVLPFLQSRLPETPVVVFNQAGDEKQWIEVLEAGGFDLLGGPFHKSDVLSVLEHAASSYEGRCAHSVAAS